MKSTFAYLLFLLALLPALELRGQKQALLIVDIQNFYFPGGKIHLEGALEAANNAGLLLEHFRTTGTMVVHVRHNFSPGGEIHDFVKPLEHESVISKTRVNAFGQTGLDSLLKESGIQELVICGMQTHMCVEAAVRAASDLGYSCILVEDACATRTLQYGEHIISAADVHNATLKTLDGSYASITRTQEFLRSTQKK